MEWSSSFSSSTMETEIIFLLDVFGRRFQGYPEADMGAPPGGGLDGATPADVSKAPPHIVQAVAGSGGGRLRLCFEGGRIETLAVIRNIDLEGGVAVSH